MMTNLPAAGYVRWNPVTEAVGEVMGDGSGTVAVGSVSPGVTNTGGAAAENEVPKPAEKVGM